MKLTAEAQLGAPCDAAAIPLAQIDVSPHHLFDTQEVLPLFARLRREDPVHWCADSKFGPYWSVTRHADVLQVASQHAIYSSASELGGVSIDDSLSRSPVEGFAFKSFIATDPPLHGTLRKAVQPIVTPQNLQNFKALIEQRTADLLDGLPVNEEFDWVENVAVELTTLMMATLFDIPYEDRFKLRTWSDAMAALEGAHGFVSREHRVGQLMECMDYFVRLRDERVKLPPKFDLVSMLAHDPDMQAMTPLDYLGQILILIVGANDTTRNSMSASVNAAHLFPAEFHKLKAEPERVDNMVKEIIRWQTPIAHMRRTAIQDTQLGGKTIRKGDKVVMWHLSANRDETVFEEPDAVRLDRPNANRHVAFGFGVHHCLGQRVAELQLRILWQEILKRFEAIEITGPVKRLRSNQINGYTEIKVRLRPKSH